MKAHKRDMYAAWARDAGIDGFEQHDPKWQAKHRLRELKRRQKLEEKTFKEKRFN